MQIELSGIRREISELRKQQALAAFSGQLAKALSVEGVHVLSLVVPNADVDTLRSLADSFRERYPKNGAAVLASGAILIAAVTEDLVKRGLKAGDLIAAIGGRGGGRPQLAQGSLPDGTNVREALERVPVAIRERLK